MKGDRHLRFDALIVALGAVLVGGGYVLVWADGKGLVGGNQLFSIWAIPLYVGFATSAYILLLAWIRRRGSRPDVQLAGEYRFAVAGAALFVVALVAEFVWRSVGGRPPSGPEGVLSPTRLALFAATILLLSGPLLSLAARARQKVGVGRRPDARAVIGAVAFGLVLSVLTLMLGFVHPFVIRAASATAASPQQAPTDLYFVPVNGSGSRRLTTTPEFFEAHPDVSSDGARIAFARGALDDFRIYTMAVAGGDEREITALDRHEDGPVWLSGTELSFWADVDAQTGTGPQPSGPAPAPGPSTRAEPVPLAGLGVWTVGVDGGAPQLLTGEGGQGFESRTATDGRFCGWSVETGTLDVAIWDASGKQTAVVAAGPSNEWACSWSPDGTRVAFHSDRDGSFEIYSAASDGGDMRRLTTDEAVDQLPRWSPTGTQIAFISTRDGEFEIFVANADGSGARNVTNDRALDDGFYGIAWVPDGSGLVAASSGRTYGSSPDVTVPLGVAALVLAAVVVAG